MDLEIHVIPISLKLISSHETGGGCYAAHFNRNGKLLMGCHDGIHIYSGDYDMAERTIKGNHVTSIASNGVNYLIIEHKENQRLVTKSSSNLTNLEEIFNYGFPGRNSAFLAATSKFVIACSKGSLVVYNFATKLKTMQHLDFQPKVLRFDSVENLFVTSTNGLHKYSLDNCGKLTPIWTCSDIVGAGGIAFTRCGDIVVQSYKDRQIYIISPQG